MAQDLPNVGAGCKPSAGSSHIVRYPFVRDKYEEWAEDGSALRETWSPGVVFEWISPEDTAPFADAEGQMILSVVDVFKPGKFPTRVFYTRQFIDPDGKIFGNTRLHICTLEKFRRIASRYFHPYSLNGHAPRRF